MNPNCPKIPDSELMAEALGMIVLCENCGKRLKSRRVMRVRVWEHEDTDTFWCDKRGEWRAYPKSGPLADEYAREPK